MTTFSCHRPPYIGLGGTDQSVVMASYFVVLLFILARMSAVDVSDCISVHLHLFTGKNGCFSLYSCLLYWLLERTAVKAEVLNCDLMPTCRNVCVSLRGGIRLESYVQGLLASNRIALSAYMIAGLPRVLVPQRKCRGFAGSWEF